MNSGLTQAIDSQRIAEHMTFGFEQSNFDKHFSTDSDGYHYVPVDELLSGQRQADMQQALRNYLKKGYLLDDISTELSQNKTALFAAQCIPRCMALALTMPCHDYQRFYELLEAEPEYRFAVKASISKIHEHKPVDVLTLYKAAGLKNTANFCTLFSIYEQDLAGAIVLADDLKAAQLMMQELWEAKWKPDYLTEALTRVPLNPLSRIGAWRYPEGRIPDSELLLRYKNQTGVFKDEREYTRLSAIQPQPFGPDIRLQACFFPGIDHGLHLLPGYREFISRNKEECANLLFSRIQSNNEELIPELFKLASAMTSALVNAGMEKENLLFTHTIERPRAWFDEYQRGSFNHLPRVSRCEALVDSLVKVTGTRHHTGTKYDIFKILLTLESMDDLVSACDTDEKRHAVHEILPDHRLVESMTPNGREDLLHSDLGL